MTIARLLAAAGMFALTVGSAQTVPARNTAAAAPRPPATSTVATRPNVVVILVDDLGWPDVSSYGRSEVPTPNLDRIAKTGVAFSNGYVAASVCAVSRAGLLTGRTPASFGFTYNINDKEDPDAGLPRSEQTLADRLKPLGYRTAAIGKWHQGSKPEFYPTDRGFDEFFGFLSGETIYIDPATPGIVTTPTPADGNKPPIAARGSNAGVIEGPDARPVRNFDKYLTEEITDRSVRFIESASNQPFFAYVAYNAPHWPLQVPQRWYDRFPQIKDPVRRTYVAMIAAMDDGVGRIIDALERKGIRDNSIILFLSDNGCPVRFGFCASGHHLGAGKFTYLEGGVRVPFLLSWPRRLKPQGIVDSPVSALDIVPTVLHAAAPDKPLPGGLDGVDLLDALEHPPKRPRLLLWGQEPVFAARQGNLKFWRDYNRPETASRLFDLGQDAWERHDLSAHQSPEVRALSKKVDAWRKTLPKPLWPRHLTQSVTIEGRETEMVY